MGQKDQQDIERTQILITGIPRDKFQSKWPESIKKTVFEEKFPELSPKMQYFTPLPFLNRIVIIMTDEESTLQVYNFLKSLIAKENGRLLTVDKGIKLFMMESLLPLRSASLDDVGRIVATPTTTQFLINNGISINVTSHDDSNEGGSISSGNDNNSNSSRSSISSINFDTESRKSDDKVVLVTGSESASMGSLGLSIDSTPNGRSRSNGSDKLKPILSLDTNPFRTGITRDSLTLGSPSLSPDRSSIEAPTLLKFSRESKPYLYKEPLPRSFAQNATSPLGRTLSGRSGLSDTTIVTQVTNLESSPVSSVMSSRLVHSATLPTFAAKASHLTIDTKTINQETSGSSVALKNTPKSPSIVIDQTFS